VTQHSYPTEPFSSLAYIALDDLALRARVISILEDAGWTVVTEPTGFHLLGDIADVIDGEHTSRRPGLIVIDAYARGCAGATIALGLRELDITIPIVLALAPGQPRPAASSDRMLHVVERDCVERVVHELARSSFASIQDRSWSRTDASTHRA
jgi:hypothetical protein